MKIAFVLLSVVRAPIAKRAAPLCGSDNFSTENVSFYFYAPDKILSELPQKRREGGDGGVVFCNKRRVCNCYRDNGSFFALPRSENIF